MRKGGRIHCREKEGKRNKCIEGGGLERGKGKRGEIQRKREGKIDKIKFGLFLNVN